MIISHLRDFNSRHQITGSAKRLEKLSAFNEALKKRPSKTLLLTESLIWLYWQDPPKNELELNK